MAVTDDQALSLALDALSSLDSIREDVSAIKGVDSDILALLKVQNAEVPQPDEPEVSALPSPLSDSAEVQGVQLVEVSGFSDFAADLLGFQYMSLVVFVFLFVAVLCNFGALLWLSFSDKWRS